MERTGLTWLTDRIFVSALAIDQGRKWLDTQGKAEAGRISYKKGLSDAHNAFKEAQAEALKDLELLIGAEYTFIGQELNFCDSADMETINSLTQAIEYFDGALLVLKIIKKPTQYKLVERAFSVHHNFRYNKMPKDAFHVACMGHITRIKNSLRTPGINLAEKELLEQRLANIKTAQSVYLQKQKKVLGIV
jgi:hypothetical protein